MQWHYVPTGENPSDQGSGGVAPSKMGELWFEGLSGLVLKTNGQINLKFPGAQKVTRKG